MVSVALVKSRAGARLALARVLRAMLLPVLRYARSLLTAATLRRVAAAGSLWGALVLAFGGFYERPWQLPIVTLRVAYTVALTIAEYVARGCKPLFAEWTLPFEIARAVARCLMSNYGDRVRNPKVAQFIRWECDMVGTAAGFFVNRQLGTTTTPFHHNGLEHVWVRAASPPVRATRRVVVLYFHGGGFSVLSPRLYISFASQLHQRMRERLRDKLGGGDEEVEIEILLANYRKLPEHAHPTPVLDAVAMFDYLTKQLGVAPRDVIVAGDSAGGALALATMLRVRDADASRLPLAGFLLCPYVDLDTAEADERKAPYCVLGDLPNLAVTAAYHPREGPPSTWGDASPVHCDLRGLPPVYIQAAELDYILPHAKRLMAKATADGVPHWELEIFHNVPHVFTNFPSAILPSAARGIDAAAEYAAAQFAPSMPPAAAAS